MGSGGQRETLASVQQPYGQAAAGLRVIDVRLLARPSVAPCSFGLCRTNESALTAQSALMLERLMTSPHCDISSLMMRSRSSGVPLFASTFRSANSFWISGLATAAVTAA